MGPNGSGKTTLINVISGFYAAQGGRVEFGGSEITNWPPHRICKLGLVRTFQIPAPFKKLTVLENLLVARAGNPGESFVRGILRSSWVRNERQGAELAFKILRLLNLDSLWNVEASKLSGGQTKLLEIGRALMSGAKFVLMDEPISGLNPTLAHEVFSHILRLRRDFGMTFLFVEHRLEVALQYVDFCYVMAQGKVISKGNASEILKDPAVIEAYLGVDDAQS
jgi:branched-chain amino acid transport system ATP-binding protein